MSPCSANWPVTQDELLALSKLIPSAQRRPPQGFLGFHESDPQDGLESRRPRLQPLPSPLLPTLPAVSAAIPPSPWLSHQTASGTGTLDRVRDGPTENVSFLGPCGVHRGPGEPQKGQPHPPSLPGCVVRGALTWAGHLGVPLGPGGGWHCWGRL